MNAAKDWTDGFFTGLIADSQRAIAEFMPTAAEAEFLATELALRPGDHVLDVPCGTGRLAIALAAKGYRATGIDRSAELLRDGQNACPGIQWIERDMRQLEGLGPFDAAYCFGNSFAYFNDRGNQEFLHGVAKVLKPGGRFALETHFAAETVLALPLGKRWYEFGDILFLHESQFDPPTSILTSQYQIFQGGQIERRTAHYRVFFYRELLDWLELAGLKVRWAYGSLMRDPFRLGAAGLWVIAERAAN